MSALDPKMALLILKGTVTELPEEDQARFKEANAKLDAFVTEYGEIAQLAVMMESLELSCDE